MLNKDEKQKVIENYAVEKGDTGSPEVQIGLLTTKIEKLTDHLKTHQKDNHSRRGLLNMLSKRRRLLNLLQKVDVQRAQIIADRAGLKA